MGSGKDDCGCAGDVSLLYLERAADRVWTAGVDGRLNIASTV